jgi:3-deoxy-7-phosphoheptulonate synthase
MRVYFEKPRTVTGWKGLINDPGMDGSHDVHRGLRLARRLLLEVVRLGLSVGCEWLDPVTPQYMADVAVDVHTFFGVTHAGAAAVVTTAGNPDTHVILRAPPSPLIADTVTGSYAAACTALRYKPM